MKPLAIWLQRMRIKLEIEHVNRRAKPWPSHHVNRVVFHHAGGDEFRGSDIDAKHAIEMINVSHKTRNWGTKKNPQWAPCISYHYVINPTTGTIFNVNKLNDITWHAQEANPDSIGVMVLGNFETQIVDTTLIRSIDFFTRKVIRDRLGLSKKNISWHNEAQEKPTLCPGKNLITYLESFREL